MLELSLPSKLQRKAERIGERVEQLQQRWPGPILLSASAVSIYDCFPYLFEQAFPSIREEDLDSFAVAARLYASSIFLHDKVFDRGALREAHSDLAPVNGMRIMAMQWEAYRLLHGLFPEDRVFWEHFHCNLRQFTAAGLEEERFADARPWTEFTEGMALEIAKGKNGIARTTIAGLAEMDGNSRALAPLNDAIDCYNCARQMWDDLIDWKEDLDAGMPSLLLTRILGKRPEGLDGEQLGRLKTEVGREVFYGGHAEFVLQLALGALERADTALVGWPKLSWRKVQEDLRGECRLLMCDIERIVAENVARVRSQPAFELGLPDAASDCQRLAWRAMEYLVAQWRQGFGEARHVMHFPAEAGFGGPAYHRGDVFQRALMAEALCDAEERWQIDLRCVIDQEMSYLMGRRVSERGGWSYFPELPELPPDADDLAEMMQLLCRRGCAGDVDRVCGAPLAVLLEENSHADGGFETWIIPSAGRTRDEARQAEFARTMWGTGPDPDVMANLLYALLLARSDRYSANLERGIDYLLARQMASGFWESTWYHGPYYGTHVCLRLLCQARPAVENIGRAAVFLRSTQNADGGWGSGSAGNTLDTALALLALGYVQETAFGMRDDICAASSGLAYLRAKGEPDGAWPAHEFVRMDSERTAGGTSQVVSYGSRSMTTTFVLKAAATWDGLIQA